MKANKNLTAALTLAVCLLLAQAASGQQSAASPEVIGARVDAYVSALVKLGRFSGSVLVARDGKVLVSKGYGLANLELEVPNTPQTKYRIGSLTKQFTAAGIMILRDRGKLDVQDPICKYVADCPAAWQPITLHHLLTHTSGVVNYTGIPEYRQALTTPATVEALIDIFKNKPLEFPPGTKFNYTNSGYILLGYVIEKASGSTYESFLRDNIFTPLGMGDTGYDNQRRIIKRRASGYSRQGDATVNAAYLDMSRPFAAGGLYSTAEDLFKWEQSFNTEKLLSRRALDAVFKTAGDVSVASVKGGYGYGWLMTTQFNRSAAMHGGGIFGFSSFLARFPDEKVSIIVLSNLDVSPTDDMERNIAAVVFGEKYEIPREHKTVKVDPGIYDKYVGQYEVSPTFIVTITNEGGKLMLQATGQPKFELFPESETQFFMKAADIEITFVKGAHGQVTHLILVQSGRTREVRKIK